MTDPQDPKRLQTGKTTPLTSDLAARIARAERERQVAEKAGEAPARDMSGWNRGMRLGSEFIAAILVGAGGSKMKEIASGARADMERLFGGKVFLDVWVRVRKGWADDEASLTRLGY